MKAIDSGKDISISIFEVTVAHPSTAMWPQPPACTDTGAGAMPRATPQGQANHEGSTGHHGPSQVGKESMLLQYALT